MIQDYGTVAARIDRVKKSDWSMIFMANEIDFAKLKEAASRATPGPWLNPGRQFVVSRVDESQPVICDCVSHNKNDLIYLTMASPDVVLSLIADCQDKREALYGIFLLINKLRDILSLPEDAKLREVVDAATERIERLEKEAAYKVAQNDHE